jgi:hypothetical protein
MSWTEKDKVLFSIVNSFGKKHLDRQIYEASKAYTQLKTKPEFFEIFGYYDLSKNIFVWQNNMNIQVSNFSKQYLPVFGSDETLKKLFRPVVKFDEKDMNVIPYLMDMLHGAFNVIRFKSKNAYVYALVRLNNIKETFKFDEFNAALFIYREHGKINKKYSRNNSKRKMRNKTHRRR